MQANNDIQALLLERVSREYLSIKEKTTNTVNEFGPLEINDFSVCFGLNQLNEGKVTKGIYVKIPKDNFYKKFVQNILPIDDKDRILAENEYTSLKYIAQNWKANDLHVYYVEALDFLREHNAIITKRIYAKNILSFFRKNDLLRKKNCDFNEDIMHTFLHRMGRALSRFHKAEVQEDTFVTTNIINKIEKYCGLLKEFGVNKKVLHTLQSQIKTPHFSIIKHRVTKNLKGLDIRNILINNNKIYFLDPGRLKDDWAEADLARFLVTVRILYWGSLHFFKNLVPDHSYEKSFLSGYGQNGFEKRLLTLLIIKELVKHWYMAHDSLRQKKWPGLFKVILKKTYIDSFYKHQILLEAFNLEK